MTSYILAQKMFPMKLTKTEFDKVKWLRQENTKHQHKYLEPLKRILVTQVFVKTCRICLRAGGRYMFKENEVDIPAKIKYIFGFEVVKDDGKPQHICKSCETTVCNAAELKRIAESTEWRLTEELTMVEDPMDEMCVDDQGPKENGYFTVEDAEIKREWSCGKCKSIFHNKDEYNKHNKSCKGDNDTFVCEDCGVEHKTLASLKRHQMSHRTELRYGCTHCPYRSRFVYTMRIHERQHSGARPFNCHHCSATFSNPSNLASHRRKHLPPQYHCELCSKAFKFQQTLRNHMASLHSNVKPFDCNICGKAFATRKMFLRHGLNAHNRPKMRPGVKPLYIRQQEENDSTMIQNKNTIE